MSGGASTVVPFTIRLTIPGASEQILNSSSQDFRAMEEKLSKQILEAADGVIAQSALSVAIVKFTRESPLTFVADSQIAVNETAGSEALASKLATLSLGLRTADVSSASPGASVLGLSVIQYPVSNTSTLCDVFESLYNCSAGYACNDTDGTAKCTEAPPTVAPPTVAPTTVAPTTVPPTADDDSNTGLIVGLSVGIPVFLLLAALLACLVCLCTRRRRRRRYDDQSSQASGQQSNDSVLHKRWAPQPGVPYNPFQFRESGSSRSNSTASGQARPRPVFPLDKQADQFVSPWMAKGAATSEFETPREQGADRAGPPNANSNFSWEYMFSLLEPHVP
ncbi:hypothetical protein EGW08_005986, partial [Elysia chlorotica]